MGDKGPRDRVGAKDHVAKKIIKRSETFVRFSGGDKQLYVFVFIFQEVLGRFLPLTVWLWRVKLSNWSTRQVACSWNLRTASCPHQLDRFP